MTEYFNNPHIIKTEIRTWEESPFVFCGDLYRAGFKRGWAMTYGQSIVIDRFDATKKRFCRIAEIPWDRYLGCILVTPDGRVFAFGSTHVQTTGNRVVLQQIDPTTWSFIGNETTVYQAPTGRKVYNSSATFGPHGFVVALETDEATAFSFRFVWSHDLVNWEPLGELCFPSFYAACPTIRYAENGYYLLSYMWQNATPQGVVFESAMARTKDFCFIENFHGNESLTAYQNLMSPDELEGPNNSDVDFIEWDGKVYFTYLLSDQSTWAVANDAWFDGSLVDLHRMYWP